MPVAEIWPFAYLWAYAIVTPFGGEGEVVWGKRRDGTIRKSDGGFL